MSGLFSFSDSAFNRQDKVSPDMLGASNSEHLNEKAQQSPVRESGQELVPQLASESQPLPEPAPINLAGVDFEAPELEAHAETVEAATDEVEPEPEPNIELIDSSAEPTTPTETADSIPEPVKAEEQKPERQIDRRKRRRALISAAVRVRDVDVTYGGLQPRL
jgi:hypothetical protein